MRKRRHKIGPKYLQLLPRSEVGISNFGEFFRKIGCRAEGESRAHGDAKIGFGFSFSEGPDLRPGDVELFRAASIPFGNNE